MAVTQFADTRPVLANDHAVTAADARVAVRHMSGALFMHDRHQPDSGRREDVHRVHKGRAHDAENLGHAVGGQGFNEGFGRSHFWHDFFLVVSLVKLIRLC